jgi:TIR domain
VGAPNEAGGFRVMTKIAISYRRADSQDITGRICDRLVQTFGKQAIFLDIDSIRPGFDFRRQIEDALQHTDVLLAIVGPKWLDRNGSDSKIDSESDFVRIEVGTALKRNIPVIPILVGGAKMPSTKHLPDEIKDFAFRNAVIVASGRDFDHHMNDLIRYLRQLFEPAALIDAGERLIADRSTELRSRSKGLRPYLILSGLTGLAAAAILVALYINPWSGSNRNPGEIQSTAILPPNSVVATRNPTVASNLPGNPTPAGQSSATAAPSVAPAPSPPPRAAAADPPTLSGPAVAPNPKPPQLPEHLAKFEDNGLALLVTIQEAITLTTGRERYAELIFVDGKSQKRFKAWLEDFNNLFALWRMAVNSQSQDWQTVGTVYEKRTPVAFPVLLIIERGLGVRFSITQEARPPLVFILGRSDFIRFEAALVRAKEFLSATGPAALR